MMYADDPSESRPRYDAVETCDGRKYDTRKRANCIVALQDAIKVYTSGVTFFIPRHNVQYAIRRDDTDAP